MKTIRSEFYARKRSRGIKWIAYGSFLLLTSFILTVFLFHKNASIDVVMYGLTSVGIVMLMIGLVDLIG
jgi:hypothetical protein